MRYASGNIDDLNRIKQQMTMEAITQGTAEHIMHHVMINFILNGKMRFMQFDFTRESADTKNVFPFVEAYPVPQPSLLMRLGQSWFYNRTSFFVYSWPNGVPVL